MKTKTARAVLFVIWLSTSNENAHCHQLSRIHTLLKLGVSCFEMNLHQFTQQVVQSTAVLNRKRCKIVHTLYIQHECVSSA